MSRLKPPGTLSTAALPSGHVAQRRALRAAPDVRQVCSSARGSLAATRLALVRGRVVRQDEQDAPAAGVALHHALHLPALQGGADRGSHGGGGGACACLLAQRRPRTWKRMPCAWLLWKAACSLSSVAWPWQ